MKHNNISNNVAPVIAFDMDSLLFVGEEKKSLWKKLFPGKLITKPFNKETLKVLEYVWRKHEASLYLVSFEINDEDQLNDLYERLSDEGIALSNIVFHQEWDDVMYRLSNGRYKYLFSNNEDLVNHVGKNAYLMKDFKEVL